MATKRGAVFVVCREQSLDVSSRGEETDGVLLPASLLARLEVVAIQMHEAKPSRYRGSRRKVWIGACLYAHRAHTHRGRGGTAQQDNKVYDSLNMMV